MRVRALAVNTLVAISAVVFAGASFVPHGDASGPVLNAAVAFVHSTPMHAQPSEGAGVSSTATKVAVASFARLVRPLSRPEALEDAFKSYFAYRTSHVASVKKPYLYFVDYGLPSTEARGYVFDMDSLTVVDGPFTVAHGRGSSTTQYGVPTTFSNASDSHATSLGLYVAQSTYDFHGHAGGSMYSSIGLRLQGVSAGFNDNALARRVVAHGAPYVTATRAGRSEGCPAMEPARAQRLLPKLAGGGMVFLFAPDEHWMSEDPWLTADAK